MHPFQLLFHQPRKWSAAGVALIALLAIASVGRAAVYYVDFESGADTNTGTGTSTAWKHCPGDPAAAGVSAVTSLVAGDTVQFKGGVTYVLSASIAVPWNGVSGAPITYDGNTAGSWGTGRAKISDQNGGNGLSAFTASSSTSYVSFKNLEFSDIGGAVTLPVDSGTPTAARYGAGLKFPTGVSNVRIENCAFRGLGYTFNKKPMNAASISGSGIALGNVSGVAIVNCQFSNVAYPIDLQSATAPSGLEIGNCTFSDAFVWSVNVPSGMSTSGLTVYGCTEASNQQFARSNWTGYGESPRTSLRTVTSGTSVTFGASAIASPSSTYQWQKNGVAVPGATSSVLTLNAVTSAEAGTYTVIATNAAGANTSNEAVLVVNDPLVVNVAPTITRQPVSQTAAATASVSFTASASGTPTPTYQWLKNGAVIAGATSTTLNLAGVSTSDIGTYSMVATNSMGSATSVGAALNVTVADTTTAAPIITAQPTNQTAPALSSATFTVSATGVPAPAYQWLKNGVSLASATGATLTLTALTSNDVATYSVVVANIAGSVTSNGATLTVTGAPVITTQPVSQTVAALSSVSFNVTASGSPTPSYQWLKNGVAVTGATGATFSIPTVSTSDAGTYTVNVWNVAGSVTSTPATLAVSSAETANIAPSITVQPVSQTVTALSTVTFSAGASGSPVPTYQWRKNGVSLIGATSSTLTLSNVSTADAGSYSFVATNSAGSATSSAATLTVNVSPAITLQPASQTVSALSTVTFTANASGIPAPTFQWLKNGTAITGSTNTSLTLASVSSADAATYTFVARNVAGTATSTGAVLTVLVAEPTDIAPAITSQPVSQTVNNKSNVTFTVAATGNPSPSFQWQKDGQVILGATNASLVLRNVSKGNAGTYSVVASNRAGSVTSGNAVLVVNTGNRRSAGVDDVATVSDTRLVNLSVRSSAGSGDESLIVGFVVQGDSPKSLLVRGVGPTLSSFGVPDSLANPSLSVYSGQSLLAANEDWAFSANASQIAAAADATGAFKLASDSADAAILSSVVPGAYTAQIGAEPGARRTALVELYDAEPDTSARLVNVSVRTVVSRTDSPVIGFVVRGSDTKSLLIRAVGPTLRAFGVNNALSDPQLEIYKDSTRIDQNDNWGNTGTLASAFQDAGAFALDTTDGRDAALIVRVAPGAYTAVVSGVGEADGVVVVEVYELPDPATVQ